MHRFTKRPRSRCAVSGCWQNSSSISPTGTTIRGFPKQNANSAGPLPPDLAEVGPLIIQKLEPVMKQAESTLAELQKTSHNLTVLTAQESVLTGTLKSFGGVGENLKTMTAKGGGIDSALVSVHEVLANVKDITVQLQKDNNLEKTLGNFKASSAKLKTVLDSLDKTMGTVLPRLDVIVSDLSELTGKLKQQPWRVIWPSTIKYPEGQAGAEEPPRPPRKRRTQN